MNPISRKQLQKDSADSKAPNYNWNLPILYAIWIVTEDKVNGKRQQILQPVSLSLLQSYPAGLCSWEDICKR
jgi:hypothetical protein